MSDGAKYGFLSVMRRGLAAMIPAGASGDARINVPVSFSVGGSAAGSLPPLALRGAGDVIGFDTSAIRRIWPVSDADNAEPNYFALIEFAEADLPWRYSPDAPAGDRLAPWICLIVLQQDEVVSLTTAAPFSYLTVHDASVLPDLSQSWAWAHAQIVGAPFAPDTDFTATSVDDLLASNPGLMLSRLLCPRRLNPRTNYVACLVPTLERARLAGLGQAVDGVARLTPAWTSASASLMLPVYFSWKFHTADTGDFASLAAKLKPVNNLPDQVWRRDFAVSAPGAAPPVWQIVGLEGALLTVNAQSLDWSTIDEHGFSAAMAAHTNVTTTTLAPTLYGRWLAASNALSTAATAAPRWFHQLNGDPRARVAAGLGTVVVQKEQQEVLASAWAQVDGIRQINLRLRLSQLARELSLRVFTRHFSVAGDALLQITAPFHGHVRNGASTVRGQLDSSAIVPGALAPAWRRAARPFGSLGVRQGRPSVTAASDDGALSRMNRGTLAVVAPPPSAAPTATGPERRLGNLAAAFAKANVRPENLHTVSIPTTFTVKESAVAMAGISSVSSSSATTATSSDTGGGRVGLGGVRTEGDVGTTGTTDTTTSTAPPASDIPPAAFAQAASALMAQFAAAPARGIQWTEADLGKVRSALLDGLNPKNTIETPLKNRLNGVSAGPARTDPIEPAMVAPAFLQAMYEPLKGISQSWLIPGLDKVPTDTVAILTTNWRFVESYLVGLNHEMARKLLWNGYPTDQRGTYFTHFWDIRSRIDGTTNGDIGPIHQWTSDLGHNRLNAIDPLILMVRGEVIRRYPNVVVYASPAVVGLNGRAPGPTEYHPIFYGRLDPDVAFFAFDFTAADARKDNGYFFVLQEHPSEPRFGLAPPNNAWGAQPPSWQALGWDHLAANADALSAIRYIDLNAALPQNPASSDGSGAVWHSADARAGDLAHITIQMPTRLAIHSSVVIPA